MKKKFSGRKGRLCLLTVLGALLLGGCSLSSTPVQYVSAVPPEQTCTLKIIQTLTVLNFDGEEARWSADIGDAWAAVQIPAGSHTLRARYFRFSEPGALDYHYNNGITIRYGGFKAGHTYELVAAEGAEAGGFAGLFTNMIQAMYDTANHALRLGIRDVTADPDADFEWLTSEGQAK